MEQDILSELATIKTLLLVNIAVMVILAMYVIYRRAIANLPILDTMRREQFVSIAQAYDDKGKFKDLEKHAKDRLDKYPKDTSAWWYLALSQYKSDDRSSALNSFSELQSIDPAFFKTSVTEYIDEIRSSMQGPKDNDA